MSTPAGQRRDRVVFMKGTTTRGGLGDEPVADFVEVERRWGKALYGTGSERRQLAAEQASQTTTVRVLSDSFTRTVGVAWRMQVAGLTYDIQSIAPIGREDIDFTGTAARD